jgi:hypothetical protein
MPRQFPENLLGQQVDGPVVKGDRFGGSPIVAIHTELRDKWILVYGGAMPPKPGELYRHFKGNLYRIIAVATHTETQEPLVIYQSQEMEDPHRVWARPLADFTGNVSRENYSGPRFVLVPDDVDCELFVRGLPGGDCQSVGHYECRECQKLDPQSLFAAGQRA